MKEKGKVTRKMEERERKIRGEKGCSKRSKEEEIEKEEDGERRERRKKKERGERRKTAEREKED
jgi:hypothetical protein